MQRRKFIKNSILGLAGASGLAGLYSWQVEPFWLEFTHLKMPVVNLPQSLEGKTVMQISDMHVGNRFDYKYIIDSFIKAQQLQPDFVAYTGDYVSYEDDTQIHQLAEVLEYSVKGKLGTVAILGNHDYGKNWSQQLVADDISALLDKADILVLNNDKTNIEGLNFIGLDDYWGLKFNPQKALSGLKGSEANIVLCHNPDVCDLDVWKGYDGWILAGHTHGGQCKPPFLPPPMLPVKNKKYSSGHIPLVDGRDLYINRALGNLWQVRFNVRPEITLFELAKA